MTDYYKSLEIPDAAFEDGQRVRIIETSWSGHCDSRLWGAVGVIDRSSFDPDQGHKYGVKLDDTSRYLDEHGPRFGEWFNEFEMQHEDGRPTHLHRYLSEFCLYCGQDPFGPDSTVECPRDRTDAEIIEGLIKGFKAREERAMVAIQVLRDTQATLQPYTLQEGYQTNVMATGVGNCLRAIEGYMERIGQPWLKSVPVNAIHAKCPSCGEKVDVIPTPGTMVVPILPIDPEAERIIDEFVASHATDRTSKPIE